MPLPSFIREEAARLGFAAVGFATVAPSQTLGRFNTWLNRGYAGGMTYLARHALRRADPRQIMPEARSIIVVAAHYPVTVRIQPFSNYARGRDYHDVLRGKLKQLAWSIEAQCSVPLRSRICVDSAPVLEREWAVRAGLGWIGKQGSLVNPEWGCTLFLGELLVNLELAPSLPVPGKCGTCRRCVEACPTGAIQPDGFVDARRCIAYLTIEHQGDIPEDLRPLMGTSLFGCDRCTTVCPYNRAGAAVILPDSHALGRSASGGNPVGTPKQRCLDFARHDTPKRSFRLPAIASWRRRELKRGISLAAPPMPTAEQCLALSAADFQQRFRGTAVYRSGLARLKRNATIAMANRNIAHAH